MKNEEPIKKRSGIIDRCYSHPVVRIFCDPKVKRYFEKENKKSLEFGDLQYLLCRRKPKKEKWIERWQEYFPQDNRQTEKEVYNSKEHLNKEIRKHRERFPGVLNHSDRTYSLSPRSIDKAMKEFTLSKLNNHSDVLIMNKVTYFGIDSSKFDERDSELFDNYINHIYKSLRNISKNKWILRDLWLRLQLKEYYIKFEQVCQELPKKDKGHFIGYEHEHIKWFIQSCDANLDNFQKFFRRLRKLGLSYDREVWSGAEVYIKNVNEVMIKHRKELQKHIQMEFEKSLFKESHFKIVLKALKKMVDTDIITQKEAKWFRTQQRMSKLHLENLGEDLTSRTMDNMPLIVIDIN